VKIGLDARTMFMPRRRGTGRNLRDAFGVIPELRPEWDFVLYHQRADAAGAFADAIRPANVTARRIDLPGDRLDAWLNLRLPWAARRDRVDLLHVPANAAPAYCPVPFVATIHDLIPLRVDGECSAAGRRRFERGVRRAVGGAAHIITPSATTRDDLIASFDVSGDRVSVIPWAADRDLVRAWRSRARTSAFPDERLRHPAVVDTRARYGLARDYWIGFSGSSPRKNASGLIEALAELVRARPDVGTELVLTGCEPTAFRHGLAEQARRLGVESRCRLLGFVPHADLPGLLGGARGLVMPSLCEGFGLPILDAFAIGVPVLTSGIGSMAEVAGDAAHYCDPRDARSIARGMAALLDDHACERLAQRGAVREREFTWTRTASAMCEVYEMCLERPGGRTLARIAETLPV
jgi:alpha-1,3-rhamnosyl/mannosyltransferase